MPRANQRCLVDLGDHRDHRGLGFARSRLGQSYCFVTRQRLEPLIAKARCAKGEVKVEVAAAAAVAEAVGFDAALTRSARDEH